MSVVWLVITQNQLPKSFWNKIATPVIHIRNRCFSVEDKTFFEKYNNQLPDVSNLQVLSCQA